MPLVVVLKGLSSNKQEIDNKDKKSKKGTIRYKDISYVPIAGRVAVLKPIIDKVSIVYKVGGSDPDLMPGLIQGLLLDAEDKADFKSAGHVQTGKVTYKASVNLVVPPNGEEVLIQAGPKKSTAHDLRLEFNPARLGPAGMAFLKDKLEGVLLGALSFSHILATGRVTRLDIAVDLVGIRIDALDIQYKGEGKSHWYFSGSGQSETGYLGIKQSDKNAPWTAYNKRKQLKETVGGPEQLYGGLSHTRIEFHAKPNKPAAGLKLLSNPFTQVSVAYPTVPKGIKPHSWQFFLDACQRRGHQNALALVPEGPTKAKYLKAMKTAHDTFWRPDKIWSSWKEVLSKSALI